jgi:DNA-binding NarL/FixJ family response regulator
MPIKTLIVDNKASIRVKVREFLVSQPDTVVVGEAADGQEAVQKARQLKPDVIIMDVGMTPMNGIEATRLIKSEMPSVKVIMLTVYDIPEYTEASMAAGASGYVIKTALLDDLAPAIKRALGKPGKDKTKHTDEPKEQPRHAPDQTPDEADVLDGPSHVTFDDMVTRARVRIVRGVARDEFENSKG